MISKIVLDCLMVIPGIDLALSPDRKMGYGVAAVLYKFRRLE